MYIEKPIFESNQGLVYLAAANLSDKLIQTPNLI